MQSVMSVGYRVYRLLQKQMVGLPQKEKSQLLMKMMFRYGANNALQE